VAACVSGCGVCTECRAAHAACSLTINMVTAKSSEVVSEKFNTHTHTHNHYLSNNYFTQTK